MQADIKILDVWLNEIVVNSYSKALSRRIYGDTGPKKD